MPDLPVGWEWTSFGDVLEEVAKVNPKENPENGFVYVDIESIDNRLMRITNPKHYKGKEAPSRARQLIKSNDILFSTVRTYLKNIALVSDDYDGQIASTGFCVIRPIEPINKKMVFYLVQTDGFVNPLSNIQRGSSYPAVRNSDIYEQIIPFPPANEQHRIVAKIEELFTNLDAGVEGLKKIQAQIKRYRQAVLKYAFEGKLTAEWREAHKDELEPAPVLLERIREERKKKLGSKYKEPPEVDTSALPELPEGWEWVSVSDVCHVVSGQTPSGINEHTGSGEIPYYKVADMNRSGNEKYMYESGMSLTKDDAKRFGLHIRDEGTIIFPKRGGAIATNKVRILSVLSAFDLNTMGISPFVIPTLYVYYWFSTFNMISFSDGSNVPQINHKDIEPLVFPLAPIEEQDEIVREIERRLSIADEIQRVLEQSTKQSDRLRQSILKRAFEGKLVPQDPNDEPAELLLERIKEEGERQTVEVRVITHGK